MGGCLMSERKTVSISKACKLVGVSRRTIYNWLSAGKIEYVRIASGSVRIFTNSLWRDKTGKPLPNDHSKGVTQTIVGIWQ